MKELQELSNKFQGHYMTKMNKQLKAEKEQLETQHKEIVSFYKNFLYILFSQSKLISFYRIIQQRRQSLKG
jgi:chemotaxis protein CheY-P-specific phosphatase CheC